MKTTKFIIAFSLALIFSAGFNALYAGQHAKKDVPSDTKAAMVAYVVRINNLNYLGENGNRFLIMMTDETGRLIAPAQTFQPGVSDYTFFEGGTVRGTRVAKMMKLPIGPKSFYIPPTSHSGVFYGGACYLFIINPITAESDAGVVIQ